MGNDERILKEALQMLAGEDGEIFSTPQGSFIIEDVDAIYDFMIKNNIDDLLMPDWDEELADEVMDELTTQGQKRFDYSKVKGFRKID